MLSAVTRLEGARRPVSTQWNIQHSTEYGRVTLRTEHVLSRSAGGFDGYRGRGSATLQNSCIC